jgi:hypothetical protein
MKISIGKYPKKGEQKKSIRIDPWDTWSMDHTLADIIYPMLKQLRKTAHGAPCTDDEDVPEHLRSTKAKPKKNEWDVDEFHFKRWANTQKIVSQTSGSRNPNTSGWMLKVKIGKKWSPLTKASTTKPKPKRIGNEKEMAFVCSENIIKICGTDAK